MSVPTTSRSSPSDRRRQVIDAAGQLLVEVGTYGITYSGIAERMGVSRQWLYKLYPDLDTIYMVLYDEVRLQFLEEDSGIPTDREQLAQLIRRRGDRYLAMPPGCAVVAMAALHAGGRSTQLESGLRAAIYQNIERQWITPLVEAGFDREALFGSIIAYINVMFGLVIGIAQGLTNFESASARLQVVTNALLPLA